jgi:hypothetical protein
MPTPDGVLEHCRQYWNDIARDFGAESQIANPRNYLANAPKTGLFKSAGTRSRESLGRTMRQCRYRNSIATHPVQDAAWCNTGGGAVLLVALGRRRRERRPRDSGKRQTSSKFTVCRPIAFIVARKNVAAPAGFGGMGCTSTSVWVHRSQGKDGASGSLRTELSAAKPKPRQNWNYSTRS